jgi:hypothetical protein
VLLLLGGAAAVAFADGWSRRDRRRRGSALWAAVRSPLDARPVAEHTWRVMWDLIRGAAALNAPARADLVRRYTEMLAENLGQPGFRELLLVVHDIDAQRDLVYALVNETNSRLLIRRPTSQAAEARRAEVINLSGVARDQLADAVSAALTVPLATDWHPLQFAPDSYWCGETHRLCDRPASLIRLVDELIELGVDQILLVSAVPETPRPHALAGTRIDLAGRLGEYVQSSEAAVLRDATTTTEGVRIFTIRPEHNPIGPFDFRGGYDDRSDRRMPFAELLDRGYSDAYRQFIEPVVGASGEEIVQG